MMARKIAGTLPFLVALVLVQPLAAQTAGGHMWTPDRPDALGPASVTNHRTVSEGEISATLRYLNLKKNGVGWGTDSLSVDEVWALGYDMAPARLFTRGFALDVLYGVKPDLSVSVSAQFARKTLENWVQSADNPSVYRFSQNDNSGLQDVEISAIYNILQRQTVRAYVNGGVSIPLGSTDSDADVVDPDDIAGNLVAVRLPYQQQLGTGTFAIMPGFTVDFQNETTSLGIQGKARINVGENGQGWSYGDVYQGYLWAGFRGTEWAAVTIGVKFDSWGDISGQDETLDFTRAIFQSPAYSNFQAGWRVDLPVGVNLKMPAGSALDGHTFGVEFMIPIHQKLDQPQLREDMGIVLSWSKAFGR